MSHHWTKPAGVSEFARGFTLVELLVAMVVIGILLGAAAPSMMDLVRDTRMVGQFNRLTGAIRQARSEAIKGASEVTVCARQSTSSCSSNPDDWNEGWLVFHEADDGSGNNLEYDGNDVLLAIGDGSELLDVVANATIRPAAAMKQAAVQFDPRGRANWNLGTFIVCDGRGAEQARVLIVNGAGTLRSVTGKNGTAPLDAMGNPVTCA